MNVDIRVMVDVTQGALDLFLSPRDDSFVVNLNSTTGYQDVNQIFLIFITEMPRQATFTNFKLDLIVPGRTRLPIQMAERLPRDAEPRQDNNEDPSSRIQAKPNPLRTRPLHSIVLLRSRAFCLRISDVRNHRSPKHLPRHSKPDEPSGTNSTPGQTRTRSDQIPHRSTCHRSPQSGRERSCSFRDDLLPTGPAAHRPVRVLFRVLLVLFPVPCSVCRRVENETSCGRAPGQAAPHHPDAQHGQAPVRQRYDSLRSRPFELQPQLATTKGPQK